MTVAPRTRRGSFLASLLWAPTEVNTCISPHRGPNNSFPPQLCFPSGKSLFGPPPPPCAGRRSSHSGPSTRPKTTASRGPSPSAWAAAAPRRLEESKSQKKSSPAAATTAEVGRLEEAETPASPADPAPRQHTFPSQELGASQTPKLQQRPWQPPAPLGTGGRRFPTPDREALTPTRPTPAHALRAPRASPRPAGPRSAARIPASARRAPGSDALASPGARAPTAASLVLRVPAPACPSKNPRSHHAPSTQLPPPVLSSTPSGSPVPRSPGPPALKLLCELVNPRVISFDHPNKFPSSPPAPPPLPNTLPPALQQLSTAARPALAPPGKPPLRVPHAPTSRTPPPASPPASLPGRSVSVCVSERVCECVRVCARV